MADYFRAQRQTPGYDNSSFDPASAFWIQRHDGDDGQSLFSDTSYYDEQELIKAAKEQLKSTIAPGKEEKDKIAREVLAREGFRTRLAEVIRQKPGGIPRVEIEFKDVTIEADALVGTSSNPSVWNAFKESVGGLMPFKAGKLQTKKVKLLDGVRGVIKPGRLTLLLGPPGSGKSLLLQHLSGRLHLHKNLRATGVVKYNGEDIKDFVVQRTVGLVDQYDRHIPNLTVMETIDFAAKCQFPRKETIGLLSTVKKIEQEHKLHKGRTRGKTGRSEIDHDVYAEDNENEGNTDEEDNPAEIAALDGILEAGSTFEGTTLSGTDHAELEAEFLDLLQNVMMYRARPHIILHMLGLQNVTDTFVGDETLRGVSGGEKKRVTSAEVLVGPQWAVFMDEISTGLDSATTFSVIQSLRDICHALQRTLMISLLQPPPEVMELFDDLMLLTDGKVIFHGPVKDAVPFFAQLGFQCPERKDPGSFLQEVTTAVGQMTYASTELLNQHGFSEEDRTFEALMAKPPKNLLISVSEMENAFRETDFGKAEDDQLDNHPFDRARGNPQSLAKTHFARSGWTLSWLAFKRQMLLIRRDRAYYMARMVQSVIMGLIISSFFASVAPKGNPQEDVAQGRKVLSLCVLSVIYLSMSSMPVLGFVFNTKGVFYKHRDNHFFPPYAFSVSHAISQVPSSTAESILYSICVYWISGMTRTAGNFFIFLLITWSCSNSFASIFRFMAYVTPNMTRANALGSLVLLLLMLTNGFTIVRTSIPDYLIWIYYGLNPMSYGVRALAINELTSPAWGKTGYLILDQFAIFSNREWIWIAVAFNWGYLILATVISVFALKYLNPPAPKPSVALEEQKTQVEEGLDKYIAKKKAKKRSMSFSNFAKTFSTKKSSKPLSKATEEEPRRQADAVPFIPLCLVCRDLCYYVNDPSGGTAPGVVKNSNDKEIEGKLQLLKNIDFFVEPGCLTALMGGSGAGKTTLMDVVAGRKTQGLIRGDILVNGRHIDKDVWSRVVGYVEQMDVHSPCITVLETLRFAARLRLSEKDVSDKQVELIVQNALDTIELRTLMDNVVGDPGGEGLSIEQRKRLSIGVEMVGNPSVLFMDEPTSGLDARAAAVVMRAVRNVANSNRTVVVTIHQPSMEIFEAFDMLVLLQRGGYLTYFGSLGFQSQDLISYLEAYPGVSPIKPGYNPATWMLEVTGGSMATTFKAADIDFPKEYRGSDVYKEAISTMDELVARGIESADITVETKYATTFKIQARELVRKYILFYWRAPHYNFVRIVMTTIIALIYGLIYLNEAKKVRPGSESTSLDTVQNIMGLMFSLAIFNGMFNCMIVMPIIFYERTVFYRQKAASMFHPRVLALAQGVAEIPYLATQAIIMVVIAYWMVGFQPIAWKFFYFLLMFFLAVTMYTFLGQFLVVALPNQLLALLITAFLNQMWTIFNGFLVPYPQTPAGWKWMARISPTTWILYGLGGSQLADSNVPLTGYPGANTVGEFVTTFWGYDYGFVWWCPLIVLAYIVFFRACSVLSLTFISYNRR